MAVASWSGSLLVWQEELSQLKDRVGPIFPRRELRETGGAFLDGLLSGIDGQAWLAGLVASHRYLEDIWGSAPSDRREEHE